MSSMIDASRTDPESTYESAARLLLAVSRKERGALLRSMACTHQAEADDLRARADVVDPPGPTRVTFDQVPIGASVLLEDEWWIVLKKEMAHDEDGRSCWLIARPIEGGRMGLRHPIADGQLVEIGSF